MKSATGDGALEVMFVAEGTPAHEAGLERGDQILSVGSVPANEIPLREARAMFSRSGSYALRIKRGGRDLEMRLAARPLFDGSINNGDPDL